MSNVLLELFYNPQFMCDRIFNAILANSVFSRYQYVLNTAEAFYYTLYIAWVWKLNNNKDSRHVNAITDSQTVQARTCTDTLGHETNSKFCLRNTALLVLCQTTL